MQQNKSKKAAPKKTIKKTEVPVDPVVSEEDVSPKDTKKKIKAKKSSKKSSSVKKQSKKIPKGKKQKVNVKSTKAQLAGNVKRMLTTDLEKMPMGMMRTVEQMLRMFKDVE